MPHLSSRVKQQARTWRISQAFPARDESVFCFHVTRNHAKVCSDASDGRNTISRTRAESHRWSDGEKGATMLTNSVSFPSPPRPPSTTTTHEGGGLPRPSRVYVPKALDSLTSHPPTAARGRILLPRMRVLMLMLMLMLTRSWGRRPRARRHNCPHPPQLSLHNSVSSHGMYVCM
jgi:hypothetical protein